MSLDHHRRHRNIREVRAKVAEPQSTDCQGLPEDHPYSV